MKSEKETFRLAEILVRSFREELTPEEQAELNSWLTEDGRHRILYKRYAAEAFLREKTDEARQINWQQDYREFSRQHFGRRREIRLNQWIWYAAIFVLPLTLSIFLWMRSPVQRSIKQTAEVVPAEKAKPILTLAGGEKIILTDSVSIQETDGTLVAGEAGGLSYKRENKEKEEQQQQVIFNNLEIPRGAEYFLVLADGTQIWLNSESAIRYPVNFAGPAREVYIEGEAFFHVAKDSLHPFVVHAGASRIEVLGTQFNVRNYKDETTVATTLVKGSVRLTSEKKQCETVLQPGEQGNIGRTDGMLTTGKVDTYLYTAWKDSRFVFRHTRMEELLNTLARWYDLTIFYQHQDAKEICFTGDMSRMEDFHKILNIIENNERVHFTVNHRAVTVTLR